MAERECKTQAEVDAAIVAGHTIIVRDGSFTVSGSASVIARGSARVEARGSARVDAYGSARVEARGSARVDAYDSASVYAYGSARVNAYGSARVEARGSARVIAYGSASVIAYGSARVEAYESARVEAYESARVVEGNTGRHLRQSHPVILIGPIGSRNAMLSVYQCEDGGQLIRAGCFLGTRDEFAAAVADKHQAGQCAHEYRAALAMIDALREDA